MSSSGRMRAITPLLPWRPAILSPTHSLRFMAMYTFTSLMTPGGSSSPFCSLPIFSLAILSQHVDLPRGHLLDLVDLLVHPRVLVGVLDALQVAGGDALDGVAVEDGALGEQPLVGALVVQVGLHLLAAQDALPGASRARR